MSIDDFLQNLFQLFLSHMEIHFQLQIVLRIVPLHKTQILGQNLIEQKPSQRGLHIAAYRLALRRPLGHPHFDAGMQGNHLVLIRQNRLIHILEILALALNTGSLLGQIVNTQHHILRGHRHRTAVGGLEQIVGGQQQEPALRLGFHGQRQMHRHLVAVKVRVESGTYQRMQLDGLTFHQNRLKRLDAQSVQSRSPVEHHGMLFDDLLQHVKHLGVHSLHQLFRILDILADALGYQLFHYKGLEQLNRHLLGETALIDLELRPHHDN